MTIGLGLKLLLGYHFSLTLGALIELRTVFVMLVTLRQIHILEELGDWPRNNIKGPYNMLQSNKEDSHR